MRCPFCGHEDQKVLESRDAKDGVAIRRRRECLSCTRRFTTFEEPEKPRLFVIKKDGSREEFDRRKIFESVRVACGKRPVSTESLQDLARRVECRAFQPLEDEVNSQQIGIWVMEELRGLDEVGYIRFASVYREFNGLEDFSRVLQELDPPQGESRKPVLS